MYSLIFNQTLQIFIINLIHYEETGVQIGAGIWCGIVFVFTGIITILPRAPSVVRIRNVMLIISITFAGFFIYWSFLYVFIHKLGYNNSEYKTHRWLRGTQGTDFLIDGRRSTIGGLRLGVRKNSEYLTN